VAAVLVGEAALTSGWQWPARAMAAVIAVTLPYAGWRLWQVRRLRRWLAAQPQLEARQAVISRILARQQDGEGKP